MKNAYTVKYYTENYYSNMYVFYFKQYLIWEMINMSDGLVDSDFPIFQGNLLIYNLAILIF